MKTIQFIATFVVSIALLITAINVYQHREDIDDLKHDNYQLEKRIVQLETAY